MSEEFDYNKALKKAKLKKLDQDLKLSQEYFGTAKCITISWIFILCIVLLYQFLFVLTVFSVLVFLLHFLLFKPVLRTVLNREKNQGSSEKEILQLQAEKEQTIQKTQEVEKQANLEMSLYRATQLKQTKEKLDRILNEKKMQLEKKSQEVRLEYQKNFKSIEENIESLSDEMVEELKIKVV